MVFWNAQSGPHDFGDARAEGKGARLIGEVVCPDCNNVMARLYDKPDHVGVSAWVPAPGQRPGDPGNRRVGWTLYAKIEESTPLDDDGAILSCWRGHGDLWIDARGCREVIEHYRSRGNKVRHVARPGGVQ